MKSPGCVTVKLTVVLRTIEPLVPRIVIVNVPVGVEELLTNVKVDEVELFAGGVTVEGLNPVPARTVPGRLRAVKLTGLLNPPVLPIVIEYVVCCPCAIVLDDGDADIVKSPGDVIVKLTVVSRMVGPLVPRIVTVKVPVGVELLLTNVNVDVVELLVGGVTVEGLNPVPASTVPGRLRAVKLTTPLKPPVLPIVIVYVVCWP